MFALRKNSLAKRVFALASAVLTIAAMPQIVQAAKFYVDATTIAVKPEEKVTPATPKPVQILYEFQRDGGPNPKATKFTKSFIFEDLKASGGFSAVSETPVEGGAVLSIKFNNVVDPEALKKAKSDGFKTGLSFGLFGGTAVEDLYEVTFEYIPAPGAAPIKTIVYHKLVTTIGKVKEVIPGTQYKKADLAVRELVRQVMARGTNNLFADPVFPR
jgi:hypothetical protein